MGRWSIARSIKNQGPVGKAESTHVDFPRGRLRLYERTRDRSAILDTHRVANSTRRKVLVKNRSLRLHTYVISSSSNLKMTVDVKRIVLPLRLSSHWLLSSPLVVLRPLLPLIRFTLFDLHGFLLLLRYWLGFYSNLQQQVCISHLLRSCSFNELLMT